MNRKSILGICILIMIVFTLMTGCEKSEELPEDTQAPNTKQIQEVRDIVLTGDIKACNQLTDPEMKELCLYKSELFSILQVKNLENLKKLDCETFDKLKQDYIIFKKAILENNNTECHKIQNQLLQEKCLQPERFNAVKPNLSKTTPDRDPIDGINFRKYIYLPNEEISGTIFLSTKRNDFVYYQGYLELIVEKLEPNWFPPKSVGFINYHYIKNINLFPGKSEKREFSFTIPSEAGPGEYQLRVKYHTKDSMARGHGFLSKEFKITQGEQLIKYPVEIRVYDNPSRLYVSPTVTSNQKLTTEIKVKNKVARQIKLNTEIMIYGEGEVGQESERSSFSKEFVLEPLEDKIVEIPITAPNQPDKYVVKTSLIHKDKIISTITKIIVVEGVSGEIKAIIPDKESYFKGDEVSIIYRLEVPLSPLNLKYEKEEFPESSNILPKDTIQLPLHLNLNVELKKDGKIIKTIKKEHQSEDLYNTEFVFGEIKFVAEEPLKDYQIEATLSDINGNVVDTLSLDAISLETYLKSLKVPEKRDIWTWLSITLTALIITIIGYIITRKKYQNKPGLGPGLKPRAPHT